MHIGVPMWMDIKKQRNKYSKRKARISEVGKQERKRERKQETKQKIKKEI